MSPSVKSSRPEFSDPEFCEAQYNNRLLVANAAEHIERWGRWASEARGRLPFVLDIAYGPHPRERFDFLRAEGSRGLFVFIHGGYWRALSKAEFSWIAEPFAAAGCSVAVVNYPLCPEVSVGDIMGSVERAVARIWQHADAAERQHMVLSGHSAGGHLTAALFTTGWTGFGLPPSPFVGGLPISGVFELEPIVHTSMNADIRLTPERARAFSVDERAPRVSAPVLFAVGGAESPEFVRQSADQAQRWAALSGGRSYPIAGRNHFSVIDTLRDRGSELFTLAERLLQGR
mgnify:CR=1 FL=1